MLMLISILLLVLILVLMLMLALMMTLIVMKTLMLRLLFGWCQRRSLILQEDADIGNNPCSCSHEK